MCWWVWGGEKAETRADAVLCGFVPDMVLGATEEGVDGSDDKFEVDDIDCASVDVLVFDEFAACVPKAAVAELCPDDVVGEDFRAE